MNDSEFRKKLEEFEGYAEHMYLDGKGYVTIGIGIMLASAAAAKSAGIKFSNRDTGAAATPAEIEADYNSVKGATAGMFPVVFFLVSLVIGIGAGGSILIGQAWGAREPHKVRHIAGNAVLAGLVVGLLAAMLGGVFAEPALRALHTPPEVLADAVLYARTLMLAMPGLLLFILFSQLLRGVGDTFSPMVAMLLSTLVSCVLTPYTATPSAPNSR